MNDKATALAKQLIRNAHSIEKKDFVRGSLYVSQVASLSTGTVAKKLAAGVDIVPPGKRSCPYHFHHAEEEMFIVLEGSGTLRVAGEMLAITAGDVVFIPPGPEYPHHILNTSDAPLTYISIGTNEPIEICEYPDSDKYMVGSKNFHVIARKNGGVDYWDGEMGGDMGGDMGVETGVETGVEMGAQMGGEKNGEKGVEQRGEINGKSDGATGDMRNGLTDGVTDGQTDRKA